MDKFASGGVPTVPEGQLQLTGNDLGGGRLVIDYSVAQPGAYSLRLYDILGR